MIGQLELSEAATDRIVVFHHNFFRHDAHIKQIAIKHFLTITEAGIEPGVRVRITDQRNLIAICSTASPSGFARIPLRRIRSI